MSQTLNAQKQKSKHLNENWDQRFQVTSFSQIRKRSVQTALFTCGPTYVFMSPQLEIFYLNIYVWLLEAFAFIDEFKYH